MDSHLETKHGKVTDQIKSAVMPEDFRALKCKECSRKWYSQVCPLPEKKVVLCMELNTLMYYARRLM